MTSNIKKAVTLTVFIISLALSMTLTIPGWTGIAFVMAVASGTKFTLDQWGEKILNAFSDDSNL